MPNGVRCKKSKCTFFAPEFPYSGYIINSKGLRPSDEGIVAVRDLPHPKNVQELHSFMGKVNYYNRFIGGFFQLAAPLNALCK